jgi:bifunctional DNA-binding transcriptional regulator/antitoxin component of YhaV-PrlF toxin-antitoxin module
MSKPARLTANGNSQIVVIPRDIRSKLGWMRGDVLQLSIRGDALLVQRMRPPEPLRSVPDEMPEVGNGR